MSLARSHHPPLFLRPGLLAAGLALLWAGGCASNDYVTLRQIPQNPLENTLQLVSYKGPQPTERTEQLLRRYALIQQSSIDDGTLERLQEEIRREPTADKLYSFAELTYVAAVKRDKANDHDKALDLYGAAVAHAYWYLFDPRFDAFRNPYDPQFRGACDLYNSALEGALRIVQRQGSLRPGSTYSVKTASQEFHVQAVVRGAWHDEDIERLEFVSQYEMKGLENRHQTFGLGVPLIAVRASHAGESSAEKYYPPGLSFPVTAFLRVQPPTNAAAADVAPRACVLELHDPLESTDVEVHGRHAPLQTDISTPLAYLLGNKAFQENKNLSTLGLLNPSKTEQSKGLFMLEPYDPNRIPVLMVHGLWSSPITWMEMFNDLRAFPEIRQRFQFWFYLYPTGQPFWVSAAQLRQDLEEIRAELDPHHQSLALNRMVLVGHSMGGLVSRMQVIPSDDDFWKLVSDKPIQELQADPEAKERLAELVYFSANPSIRRIITIGTPHRGSHFANDYTRWLANKVIDMPARMVQLSQDLVRQNPGFYPDSVLLTVRTSIDSLAPESPVLKVLVDKPLAPWVRQHNIVGVISGDGFVGSLAREGDGVVTLASAHLDEASSEIRVPSDHVNVHRHPQSILEVRRILLEHQLEFLGELATRAQPAVSQRTPYTPFPLAPAWR